MYINTIADFWRQLEKTETCWNWIGYIYRSGYGRFSYERKRHLAHRFSWTLANGAIANGLNVLHRCDNPRCVRPDHLFLGTHTDNMRDMFAKGRRRIARGSRQAKAKVTEEDVANIRRRAKDGALSKELAAEFGVCKETINKMISRSTWMHVP